MKKLLTILLLILFTSCYTQRTVYRGTVERLYVVNTFFGDTYYIVGVIDSDGKLRKIRVRYSDWRQLKSGQEVVLYQ